MRAHHTITTRLIRITTLGALCLLSPRAKALDVAEGWRIHKGDDAAWSTFDFDDTSWKSIAVGQPWEKSGFPGYNGYAWYRLRVVVPETLGESDYAQYYQKLIVTLGAIDDVDTTYFNGVQIGQTGTTALMGDYWAQSRKYDVPLDLIRWGETNVIAVRVYDRDGDGGMYTGPYTLLAPEWHDFMAVKLGLGRGDGIYPNSTSAALTAVIEHTGFEEIKGEVSWRVHNETWRMSERGDALVTDEKEQTMRPGRETSVTHRFIPPAPGFYHVTCSFTREGEDKILSQSMMLGFAPEDTTRPPDAPDTMKAFWDETRAELATVDPRFKVTPSPQHSTPDIDCYLVEMFSLGDVHIRGWYEVPKSSGPHPALLRVPGYTSNMQPAGNLEDMIVLSLNIRGHGNSQDDVPGGRPDFLLRGIEAPKSYFYRGAYMDCIRGLDFLASRSAVDTKRIGVTGGSQGGMLSLATAALDPRVMLCAPDIPYVIDSFRAFHITEWPGSVFRDWLVQDPATHTQAQAREVLSYFDPKNLAGWIRCPVFMGVGLQDTVCPAPTNFSAYNQITAEKQYRVYPFAGHGLPGEHYVEQLAWIRTQFATEQ